MSINLLLFFIYLGLYYSTPVKYCNLPSSSPVVQHLIKGAPPPSRRSTIWTQPSRRAHLSVTRTTNTPKSLHPRCDQPASPPLPCPSPAIQSRHTVQGIAFIGFFILWAYRSGWPQSANPRRSSFMCAYCLVMAVIFVLTVIYFIVVQSHI